MNPSVDDGGMKHLNRRVVGEDGWCECVHVHDEGYGHVEDDRASKTTDLSKADGRFDRDGLSAARKCRIDFAGPGDVELAASC
ncbi:hypothetical protein FLL57_08585 [Rhodopseudomonas palustris]|uniref:hypothetical protein n=1 Tax=Rhodopseudomonas palustris TaxID=1076 RepID=UPI00115E92E8|nr:hypothetical protein [Rhodopseudomonas palustris]QDL97357.1 hypothetical protein FLL57_08585 [Rhodopseudomonas palustris]